MLAGGPYNPADVPWDEYRHALYAHRFGWTPTQTDEMPLVDDAWLLPICAAIDDELARRDKKEAERAERKQKGGKLR